MTSRIAFCILLCWAGAACVSACAPLVPNSPPRVKLKVVSAPFLSNAPFFIAADEGYFAQQGLEVEFVKFASDIEAIPGLIAGDLDVSAGILALSQFNAIARGADLRLVADRGSFDPQGCTFDALVVRKSLLDAHKLDAAAGLRTLVINYRQGAYPGYVMDRFLASKGLSPQDVLTQNLAPPVAVQALENGSLDLAEVSEPDLSQLVQGGKIAILARSQDVTGDRQFGFMIYGPNLLRKNPDAGRRFMIAYLKGVRQYNQGKTERNLDLLAKNTGLDRERIRRACWSPIRADGAIDTTTVSRFENWGVAQKLLDQVVEPDRFWDPSFIDYANRALP